MKRTTLRIEIS